MCNATGRVYYEAHQYEDALDAMMLDAMTIFERVGLSHQKLSQHDWATDSDDDDPQQPVSVEPSKDDSPAHPEHFHYHQLRCHYLHYHYNPNGKR